MKSIVCIDASIQSSGVAVYDLESKITFLYSYTNKVKKDFSFKINDFEVFISKQMKFKKDYDYFKRYYHVAETIYGVVKSKINTDVNFNIEGYAYSGGGKNFNIGEFGALLKYNFYKDGYDIINIAPSEWKKVIIGKGNANKKYIYDVLYNTGFSVVLDEFIKNEYPYKKGSFVEDICDVYSILKFVKLREGII